MAGEPRAAWPRRTGWRVSIRLYPVEHDPGCQRSRVAGRIDETGKSTNLGAGNAKIKAKKAAFGEVIVDQRDH